MITPNEIRSKKIAIVESDGYDRNEVNQLLVDVIESYEAVCSENKELYRKMEILANKIEEYREDEDSIKTAIISAQKMATQVTNEANTKAQQKISDSEIEAEKIVNEAKENAQKVIGEARTYVAELTKEKQEAADAIVEQAEAKANTAISSAQLVAQDTINKAKDITNEIVEKSKKEQQHYEDVVNQLKAESGEFKTTLVALYESQIEKIKKLTSTTEDAQSINALQEELESIVTNINELASDDDALEAMVSELATSQEPEEEPPVIETPDDDEEEEIDVIDEPEADEEIEEIENEEYESDDEVDEIINEIENLQTEYDDVEEEEPLSPEEIESALNAFSDDRITPVEGTGATISVIEEEPELEFEKFFKIDRENERTNETISLKSPDEDDDEDEIKFRGFFKKKK